MTRRTPVNWQGTVIGHWLLEEPRRGRKAGLLAALEKIGG